MTYLRRRGLPITVYRSKTVTDNRGNEQVVVDMDNPRETTAWLFPQRTSRAEVQGQQHINVVRVGVDPMEDVSMWSRVEFMGKPWDIASPPSWHQGTRHTQHWSIDLRERSILDG